MNKTLHFDCLSGISGDMTLGALIDLGVPADQIQQGLQSLKLPELKLRTEEVKKCGFRAIQIYVDHPEEKAHRHLHHIDEMIDQAADINDSAKALAKKIFLCVGEAEAKVHGCTLRKVHFHEVGAIDSIADIVGVAIAIDALDIARVTSSHIPTGTGAITIDHGRVAVPAPATAEILTGVPIMACDIESELTTPTGAAIIKTLASSFGPAPAMTPLRVGYGSGTRDLEGQANILRVTLGESVKGASSSKLETDRVTLLESNIDDASPEQLANVSEALMQQGALDVWQTPIVMKKGRLASTVAVLCEPAKIDALQTLLFTHTSTIGIRRTEMDRSKLPREQQTVQTPDGAATGKTVRLPDGSLRFSLENDEVQRLCRETNKTADQIRQEAQSAFDATK
ncbi:nickel pincer cofactor biosynthesis protein LarC [Rhodopirellula sp. JC740]|uniref:Putative nickel insertion protein n=1 Tax=Rhodopirellula halodulae TaxID=2894198 RepID=A0ABS8NDY5_9BACT|nr:nickel pincer cofactor biosynthesis protein LarC [Rhodopirellula sp. JC740]MCC9641748.1 nickel pincer cofactor biosynthesis protein LarC [Rhodopirellula sp. JC740]